jgi:hypothetical protein
VYCEAVEKVSRIHVERANGIIPQVRVNGNLIERGVSREWRAGVFGINVH